MGRQQAQAHRLRKTELQVDMWDRFQLRIPEWLRDGADLDDLHHIYQIAEAAWLATHGRPDRPRPATGSDPQTISIPG